MGEFVGDNQIPVGVGKPFGVSVGGVGFIGETFELTISVTKTLEISIQRANWNLRLAMDVVDTLFYLPKPEESVHSVVWKSSDDLLRYKIVKCIS